MSRAGFFAAALVMLIAQLPSTGHVQTVIDSDFSKGDFAKLGWKADGAWDWIKCDWPPLEHDDYYGGTLAALAVGYAPGE